MSYQCKSQAHALMSMKHYQNKNLKVELVEDGKSIYIVSSESQLDSSGKAYDVGEKLTPIHIKK